MKILLVGVRDEFWSRTAAYSRAFKNLGCNTEILGLKHLYKISFFNRLVNFILKLFNITPVFYGIKKLNINVLNTVNNYNPDLVFFLKPVYIKPQTLKEIKEKGIKIFSWHSDDMFYKPNASTYFYNSIPLYDCHFTTKSFNVPEVLKKEAQKAEFLPHAVDIEVHRPIEVPKETKEKLGADIVFIGTYANDKRVKYTEKLCEDGFNLKIYGNNWEKVSSDSCLHKRGCIQKKPMCGEDFCKVISSSKLILAFLRAHNRDVQTSRTYEIPACKGFMIHERTNEATNILKEGEEAEFFNDYQELKQKIDYYLKHPKEREKIAKNGYYRMQQDDVSYKARAKKVLETYKDIK
jgi:spore maturation protein CgeB